MSAKIKVSVKVLDSLRLSVVVEAVQGGIERP